MKHWKCVIYMGHDFIPKVPNMTTISDVDLKLGDWNISKMPTSEIYKSSWINKKIFKTDYHVKTIEHVYGINKEFETCYLLSPATIKVHKK